MPLTGHWHKNLYGLRKDMVIICAVSADMSTGKAFAWNN